MSNTIRFSVAIFFWQNCPIRCFVSSSESSTIRYQHSLQFSSQLQFLCDALPWSKAATVRFEGQRRKISWEKYCQNLGHFLCVSLTDLWLELWNVEFFSQLLQETFSFFDIFISSSLQKPRKVFVVPRPRWNIECKNDRRSGKLHKG